MSAKLKFNNQLRNSLKKVNKKAVVVAKNRQARLVVTPEMRDIIKEIAGRQNTSIATVIFVAIDRLWHELGYTRADYNRYVLKPQIDKFLEKHSAKRLTKAVDKLNSFDFDKNPVGSKKFQKLFREMNELGFFEEFGFATSDASTLDEESHP